MQKRVSAVFLLAVLLASVLFLGAAIAFSMEEAHATEIPADGIYDVVAGDLNEANDMPAGKDESWEGDFVYSTKKTVEYTAVDIEDFMAEVNSYQFINYPNRSYAYRTEEGNVMLGGYDYNDGDQGVPAFKIKGSYERAAIRYKFQYTGGEIFIAYEVRGTADNSYYWSDGGQTLLMFDWKNANEWRYTVFPDGITGKWRDASLWGDSTGMSLSLEEGDYVYCEFGFMPVADVESDSAENGMYVFVNYYTVDEQGQKEENNQIYIQTKLTGDFCMNNTGWIKFYQSPYNTLGNAANDTDLVQDYLIEGIDAPVFEYFAPVYTVAESRGNYDISEMAPMTSAAGVTYSASGGTGAATRSMFNAYMPRTNMSLQFGVTFTEGNNANLGFDLSMRATGSHGENGYSVSFSKSNHASSFTVTTANATASLPYEQGKTYNFRVYCLDFSYGDEIAISGVRLAVYLLDGAGGETLLIEDYIESLPAAQVGEWFSGIVRGDSASSVTVTPVEFEQQAVTVAIEAGAERVNIGRTVRFSAESSLPTLLDEVQYVVTVGEEYVTLSGNGITGVADGVVKVKAVVTNEYGTFESEEIEVTVGAGAAVGGGNNNAGLIAGVSAAAAVVVAAAVVTAVLVVKRKKKSGGAGKDGTLPPDGQ